MYCRVKERRTSVTILHGQSVCGGAGVSKGLPTGPASDRFPILDMSDV